MSKVVRLILLFAAIGLISYGIYFVLSSTNDHMVIEIPTDEDLMSKEHYEIEILGLKDKYVIGEQFSFSFVVKGYGYSCAKIDVQYPDENGDITTRGMEPMCDPDSIMHTFEFKSNDGFGFLGHSGIEKYGDYVITVTFEKPNSYSPTKISKKFQVVENL